MNKKIVGQFAHRPIEMMESPAYQVLSLSVHRALSRLEIELAKHRGKDNGDLPCTFANFIEYRIHDHSVAPALRELEALGFIEVTERGRAGNARFRCPNLFRLTYRATDNAEATDEWRRIATIDEAEAISAKARQPSPQSSTCK
jgi:hypothetical protein